MNDYVDLIIKFSEDLAAEAPTGEGALWDYLVRKGAGMLNCPAASFFEVNEVKRRLTFSRSTGPVGKDLVDISFGYEGVVGVCAETKKPVLVNDAETNPLFTGKVDRGSGFKTKSVLAVPAIAGGELLGVAEFINSSSGAFTEGDLKAASIIVAFVAREVYIAELKSTIKQLNLRGESTINNLSGGFIGADLEGKVIFFNPKASEIFEVGGEYLNKPVVELFQLCPEVVGAIGDVIKQGKTVRRQECTCVINGRKKVIGYSSINMKGVDGKLIGGGVVFQDITDL